MTETVDTGDGVGFEAALRIDAPHEKESYLHIAYLDVMRRELRHATRVWGRWVTSVVDSAPAVRNVGFMGLSLALDAEGSPAISYWSATTGALLFAQLHGRAWRREVVTASVGVGAYSSLAFGPSALPRVAYFDISDRGLHLASRQADGWTILSGYDREEVHSIGLEIDPSGDAHVVVQGDGGELSYLHWRQVRKEPGSDGE